VLESRFRGDIRFRGQAYVKDERVEITHVTPDHVYGVVQDGSEFQTQLARSESQLTCFCTCAKPGQTEVACKHVWATILAADSNSYVNEGVRAGCFPPFIAPDDPTEIDFDDDLLDELTAAELFAPSTTIRSSAEKPVMVIERPVAEWERRLRQIRDELESTVQAAATSRDREILYQLDLATSLEAGQLVIDSMQRQRKASGQWGKVKPLKLKPGRLDEVELDEDRSILAQLGGGVADRSTWFPQQPEFQTAMYRYRLPFELADRLIPELCQTGRFAIVDPDTETPRQIHFDEGPAWQLRMSVVMDESTRHWTLTGRLSRETPEKTTTLEVKDAHLIVPGGFILRGRTLARLDDFGDYEWIRLLRSADVVRVPEGDEQEFVDRLLAMPSMPDLELPEHLRLEEFRPEPSPVLTVQAPRGRWRHEKLRCEVNFDYDGTLVRGSNRRMTIVQRELGRCLIRDRQHESDYWSQLEQKGFRRLLDRRRGMFDAEIAIKDLSNAVRDLMADGWLIQADGKQVRQAGPVHFRVESAIDWFELQAQVSFGDQQAALPELLAALARGESTVRLGDGSLGILPEEWLEQYGLLAGLGSPEDGKLKFANTQVGLLDALLSSQADVEYDDGFLQLRERIRSFSGIKAEEEPEGFIGSLRGYQREGLGWLRFLQDFGFGGCLADDMGLGKTVQLLALLQERKDQNPDPHHPSLIVVPKSLLFNWAQEAARFTPRLRVLEYTGLERAQLRDTFAKHDLIITTYGTLRRDVFQIKDHQFDYVVLDEAQTIKNSASQVAKASRLLKARHRVALSGTPIENHLGDLWSIFDFLNPGMLGRSSLFKVYAADAQNQASRDMLGRGLKPFILRRTKQQVASDLPEKVEQTIVCRMGRDQRRLYDELREHYRTSVLGMARDQGMAKTQMHVLEALLRLRQAACHPGLLDDARAEDGSAKMDVLTSQLLELVDEGHKALVFSQFTSLLALVKKELDAKGITYEYLDGQTRARKKAVDRFQTDPDCPVFLISLKAGGLGLNLTAADYVFLLDPWWNPAVEAQAIDRAHRVGQTRQVFAYRLICQDTVEEKIAELQKQKKELADAILQENNSVMKNMTLDDLDMLLS